MQVEWLIGTHAGAEGAKKILGCLGVLFIDFPHKNDEFEPQLLLLFASAARVLPKRLFWGLK